MRKVVMVLKTILLAAVLIGLIAALIYGRLNNPLKQTAPSQATVSQEQEAAAVPAADGAAFFSAQDSPAPEDAAVQEPSEDRLPDIDIGSWEFILANASHSVEEYDPDLEAIEDIELDARIIEPMTRFVNDARNQGLSVILASGYRGYEEQSELFEVKVAQCDGDEAEAATIIARPGTSEHQTGLAADITDDYYEFKTEALEKTELYQWMSTHCQEYGFIVRFPKGKEDVTGIIYEPWHFRYVGEEAAAYIMNHGLALEEFLELYDTGKEL